MGWFEKVFFHRAIEPGQHRIEVGGHIQNADRFGMKSELRPGENFK